MDCGKYEYRKQGQKNFLTSSLHLGKWGFKKKQIKGGSFELS